MSREMKHSGIDWIGVIPKGWNIDTIGNLYTLRTEKVSDKDYAPLSVTKMGIVPQLETAAKTDDGDNRKLVRVGDFAINSRSDRRGSCGISAYDGSVSLINLILTPRGQMNPRFYNWLFHSELFADEFYKWGHGIVDDLWTTRWQEMKRITIVAPSLSEQQKIAEFLNKKCGEVDEMIALQEQIIEELKAYKQSVITEAVTKGLNPNVPMKDSGIELIGEIPEHWMVSRLKAVLLKIESGVSVNAGGDFSNDGNKYVLKTSCVSRNVFIHTECKKVEEYDLHRVSCPVKADTLIVSRMNTPELVGTCGYCKNDIYNVFLPDRLWQVSLIEGMRTKYFWYLLIGNTTRNYLSSLSTGTSSSMQNISQPQFGNTPITIPPLAEQQAIVDYLDNKCGDIDALIALKQQKIESLKEYKKSIIYEYVTGKKEVI